VINKRVAAGQRDVFSSVPVAAKSNTPAHPAVVRRPVTSTSDAIAAPGVRQRSSWGPTEVTIGVSDLGGLGSVAGSKSKGHRRTPSDGRLPMKGLDNAVKVLTHHKTPAEKGW